MQIAIVLWLAGVASRSLGGAIPAPDEAIEAIRLRDYAARIDVLQAGCQRIESLVTGEQAHPDVGLIQSTMEVYREAQALEADMMDKASHLLPELMGTIRQISGLVRSQLRRLVHKILRTGKMLRIRLRRLCRSWMHALGNHHQSTMTAIKRRLFHLIDALQGYRKYLPKIHAMLAELPQIWPELRHQATERVQRELGDVIQIALDVRQSLGRMPVAWISNFADTTGQLDRLIATFEDQEV